VTMGRPKKAEVLTDIERSQRYRDRKRQQSVIDFQLEQAKRHKADLIAEYNQRLADGMLKSPPDRRWTLGISERPVMPWRDPYRAPLETAMISQRPAAGEVATNTDADQDEPEYPRFQTGYKLAEERTPELRDLDITGTKDQRFAVDVLLGHKPKKGGNVFVGPEDGPYRQLGAPVPRALCRSMIRRLQFQWSDVPPIAGAAERLGKVRRKQNLDDDGFWLDFDVARLAA
jgi:hypothetical protein